MDLLLILALFTPLAVYFAVAYFVFAFPINFFFMLGLIGSFCIGAALYKLIEAKVRNFNSRAPLVFTITGGALICVAFLLMKSSVSINEQAVLLTTVRATMVGLFVLSYAFVYSDFNKKARSVINIVMICLCSSLLVLLILLNWFPTIIPWYRGLLLMAAVWCSITNAYGIIQKNLYFHKKPVVFFEKIKGWDKHTDVFTDLFGVFCPILVVLFEFV